MLGEGEGRLTLQSGGHLINMSRPVESFLSTSMSIMLRISWMRLEAFFGIGTSHFHFQAAGMCRSCQMVARHFYCKPDGPSEEFPSLDLMRAADLSSDGA